MREYRYMSITELKQILKENDVIFNNASAGSQEQETARDKDQEIVHIIRHRIEKVIPFKVYIKPIKILTRKDWDLDSLLCDFLDNDSGDIKGFIRDLIKSTYPDNKINIHW